MDKTVKLTPKDCLYLEDALSQICALASSIQKDNMDVSSKDINTMMEETLQVLANHFEACKTLVQEACES